MELTWMLLCICSLLERSIAQRQRSFRPSFSETVIPLTSSQVHVISDYHRRRIITCLRRGILHNRQCRRHRRCLLFPRQPNCYPSIPGLQGPSLRDREPVFGGPSFRDRDPFVNGILERPPSISSAPPACNISCPKNTFLYGGQCQAAGDSLCDPGCPDDFECHHGHCDRAPCRQPCGPGLRCRNRQCVDVEQCIPACCSGQECREGRCVAERPRSPGDICDPPCPSPGYICHNGHCDRDQGCKEPCPPGYECHSGHCHREGLEETHSHCNPPCSADEECHNGHCERRHSPQPHTGRGTDSQIVRVGILGTAFPGVGGSRCNPPCAITHECHEGQCEPISQGPGSHVHDGHGHQHEHASGLHCNPPCEQGHICSNGRCELAIPGLEDIGRAISNMPDSTSDVNGFSGSGVGTGAATGVGSQFGAGSPWTMARPMNTNPLPIGIQPPNAFGIPQSPLFNIPGLPQSAGRTFIPNGQTQLVGIAPLGQASGSNQIPSPDSWFNTPLSDESRLLSSQQGG